MAWTHKSHGDGRRDDQQARFLRLTAGTASVGLLAACDTGGEGLKGQQQVGSASNQGRLRARPGPPPSHAAVSTGLRPLGLGSTRDGLLYVPAGYEKLAKVPLNPAVITKNTKMVPCIVTKA